VSNLYLSTNFGPFDLFETRYPPNYAIPTHEDGAFRVSILLSGELRENYRKAEAFASSTSVVVKPGDVRHANLFGPQGAKILSIAIHDKTTLAQYRFNECTWYHGGQISLEAIQLIHAYKFESAHTSIIEEYTYALLARLSEGRTRVFSSPPQWLHQVRERLHDEISERYSVNDLASTAGVHPVYLTRLFHRYFGNSVTRYIQQLRAHKAANLLASSDTPLAQIALEAGFTDQSHLNRTLKNQLGFTPGLFRSLMQSF